jgi:hypothetical protein
VYLSSKTFTQAAQIAEEIESLEKQLDNLLRGGETPVDNQTTPKAPPKRRVSAPKKAPSAAIQAPEQGRGTLRPAVVAVLKKSKTPLKTADIYDNLVAQGYQFTFNEPKKVLGIRLYKMLGVQALGGGLFKAK